jgi:hypothetical protein
MPLVDMRGHGAMGFAAIRAAGASAWASGRGHGCAAREWGGLPVHLATGVLEQIFESVDLLSKRVPFLPIPIPVPIGSLVLAPQAVDFALLALQHPQRVFELRDQFLTRRGPPSRLHAPVMPRSRMEYKKETLNGARRRPPLRSVTR